MKCVGWLKFLPSSSRGAQGGLNSKAQRYQPFSVSTGAGVCSQKMLCQGKEKRLPLWKPSFHAPFSLSWVKSQEQSACRGAWKTPETQEPQPWAATAWPFQPGTVWLWQVEAGGGRSQQRFPSSLLAGAEVSAQSAFCCGAQASVDPTLTPASLPPHSASLPLLSLPWGPRPKTEGGWFPAWDTRLEKQVEASSGILRSSDPPHCWHQDRMGRCIA